MSAPDENGWMPIETAPRDFVTEVDLWANGQRYTDCLWMRSTYDGKDYAWCHYAYDDCNGPVFQKVRDPSHWRQIPKPPANPHEGG